MPAASWLDAKIIEGKCRNLLIIQLECSAARESYTELLLEGECVLFCSQFSPMEFSTDRISPESHTCLARPAHSTPKSCLPGLILNDEHFPLLPNHPVQSISTKHTHKERERGLHHVQKQNHMERLRLSLSYLLALITTLCSTTVHRWHDFDTSDNDH